MANCTMTPIGMAGAAGMPAYYTPGTVDQWPLNVVGALLFGGLWSAPIPDIDRTDHLMILGANPSASQGSMLSAPDIMGRLLGIRQCGGRMVVVDPRRTQTARRASEWVPVRPGTDALLLFAILHTLAEEGWVRRPGHLAGRVVGLDEVVAMAKPFAPERVAAATGISAAEIRRLAADLAQAAHPVLYSRIGTCTQEFGTLATWLVFVLNTALGAIDRPGGALFPQAAVWSPMFMKPPDQDEPGWRSGCIRLRPASNGPSRCFRPAGAMVGIAVPEVDIAVMDDLYTQGLIAAASQQSDTPLFERDAAEVFAGLAGRGPERMMDLGIRTGPWGDGVGQRDGLTLAEVRQHPDGLRLGELEGGQLDEVLETPSGKIELVHPLLTADIPRLLDRVDR